MFQGGVWQAGTTTTTPRGAVVLSGRRTQLLAGITGQRCGSPEVGRLCLVFRCVLFVLVKVLRSVTRIVLLQ